jgi:protein-disulfide isomerase
MPDYARLWRLLRVTWYLADDVNDKIGIAAMIETATRRQILLMGTAFATLAFLSLPASAESREIVEMTLGDPNAPVTVIEYASLTCPHCATFHRDVLPRLKEEFIETGLVYFISREVFFDRLGLWGAMLARCAGEDRYFGMLDILYAQQATWSRADDAPTIVEHLYGIGRQAGMSRDAMDACLQDGDFARDLVAWYQQNATEHGIQSTPSFVINGERTGNMSWAEFRSRIEAELAS